MSGINVYISFTQQILCYFNGTISTSKIVGNGSGDFALEIDGVTTNKAIRFMGYEANSRSRIAHNDDIIDYLAFTNNGSYFYNRKNLLLVLFLLVVSFCLLIHLQRILYL